MSLVKASLIGLVRYPRPQRVIKVEVRVGESRRLCVKPVESKGSIIAGCDPLENSNAVLGLNAFCLFNLNN